MNLSLDTIRNGVSWQDVMAKLPRVPVASAISGLIVAALILMTPNPLFEAFIVKTGLPNLIDAAQPPLGAKARIVFALVAALAVTTGAWVALSIIVGRKRREHDVAEYRYRMSEETKPLRRSDAHPDAPYRRPIMAGDDLGAPLDLVNVVPDDYEEEEPLELSMADVIEDDAVVEEKAEPVAAAPEIGTEPEPFEEPVVGEKAGEPIFTIPLRSRESEPQAAQESVEKPVQEHAPEPVPEPVVAPDPVQAEAAPKPQPRDARAELAELVARLEAGLERRRARKAETAEAAGNVTPHPVAEPGNHRDAALREALDALQKLTAEGA
jgi:hypothetical protein